MPSKKRILPELAGSSKQYDDNNRSFNDTKEETDEISIPKHSPIKNLKTKKEKKMKLEPDEIFNGATSDLDSEVPKHEKSPKEMHQIFEAILEKCNGQKSFNLSSRKAICSFESLLKDFPIDVNLSPKELQSLFRSCYKSASSLKNITLEDALKRVICYTQDVNCMNEHPNFPKNPQSLYSIYCHKLNRGFTALPKELQQRFRDESDPLVIECKEEAKLDKLRFIEQLKDFLAQHSDSLFEAQISHLKKRISRLEKPKREKADNSLPNVEKKGKESKKLTAFDFYKKSKKHKYTGLDEEARDAKLRRHYDKLEDEYRRIFEELASNQ